MTSPERDNTYRQRIHRPRAVKGRKMKLTSQQLKKIIAEEVEIVRRRRRLTETRDPVVLVAQFAEEQGVTVEEVHALWDWYNDLTARGEWATDPQHRDTPESRLLAALYDSPLGLSGADIAASIESTGGTATQV